MEIRVTLNGAGGELDHTWIVTTEDDDTAEISEQIHDAISGWVLSPGDTITIAESVS